MNFLIRFKGGKNLSKVDWRDRGYLEEQLPIAAKKIKDRVINKGLSSDGTPLPPYSRSTLRRFKKEGIVAHLVNYYSSGQMWNSLYGVINAKLQGILAFQGGRTKADGTKSVLKNFRRDGTIGERSFTNQALANILSFRERGKPMPRKPGNYVPRSDFMGLDQKSTEEMVSRYERYWRAKVDKAPPALQ